MLHDLPQQGNRASYREFAQGCTYLTIEVGMCYANACVVERMNESVSERASERVR